MANELDNGSPTGDAVDNIEQTVLPTLPIQPRSSTPPKDEKPQRDLPIGETQPKIKLSSCGVYHNMAHEERRTMHSRYRRHAVQLQLDAFLDHVLPSSLNKDQLLRLTKEVNIKKLKEDIDAERKGGKHEKELFRHISATIFNRVVDAGKKLQYANANFARMKDTPDTAPISLSSRNLLTKPDSNILLRRTSSARTRTNDETYFCDVFVTCEYKKEAGEVNRQDVSGRIASEDYVLIVILPVAEFSKGDLEHVTHTV
jgi:hypothetical protein